MVEKKFLRVPLAELVPYENNPRTIPEEAVEAVRESIRQCGDLDPIEVDENMVILAGHTRRLAYLEEGVDEVDIIQYTGLTEEQKRKYRLLSNKTGELTGWDFGMLDTERLGLDFEGYDFGFMVEGEEIDLNDFFQQGDEAKAKGETYGVKVICGTAQQRDELMDMLEEQGFAPKAL